ncbi:hypothetical protein ACT3CD_03305 [Geofilum sp. OHC36d9]|uniref:hypothetical protein n=1 Tax=Geofilum sp. OHC36d9 TaxID=3458413 RepID=UPI00403341B3
MNFTKFLMVPLLASVFVGCNDDDNNEKYSDLTPQENKEMMEDEALKVFDSLEGMKDLKAMNLVQEFADLMEITGTSDSFFKSSVQSMAALKSDNGAVLLLKSGFDDDAAFSFMETFNEAAGIYTYVAEEEDWERTDATDQVTYKFNSDEGEVTVSLHDVTYETVSNSEMEDVVSDLVKSAVITLSLDDEILIREEFTALYDSDNVPTSLSEVLTIENYEITYMLSRSDTSVSLDQSLKVDGTDLLVMHFDSEGSFAYDDLPASTGIDQIPGFDFLEASNVSLTIGNYVLTGYANWKNFIADTKEVNIAIETEADARAMAEALNSNVKVVLKLSDSDETIATSDFYAYEIEGYEDMWYWDYSLRMAFSDGSYMDESYFQTGFTQLIETVSDFMESLENE